ncbi:MAG: helix-turn-helix domain-containing protein [Clostridia bacterium]|nr:helix-turn-helix domain-containing protein [Clostridia bacterium]
MFDLKKIRDEIQTTMGLSLAFYAENTRPDGVRVCEKHFERVTDDGEYTYFRFLYKNVGYIGILEGVGKETTRYALLLPSFIESFAERDLELSKTDHLKRILKGESSSMAIYKYATKYSVRDRACFVIALHIEKHVNEALSLLEQYGGNTLDTVLQISDDTCVLVRFVDEEADEGHSSMDYADFLVQSLKEELGLDVQAGVGPTVKELKDVAISYAGAENALRYADVFNQRGNVHSYREFILVKMLEGIPESKLSEYLTELSESHVKEIFEDEEILDTAECFLQNSLNVSETARNLYMHRNTLLYRLDKIEKTTGLNIRSFSDAVSFRVLTILHRLLCQ